MGIKGFYNWVDTQGVKTYIRNRQFYQKLVIDLNGILHIAIRKSKTHQQFFKLVANELKKTMKRLVAKEIALFIDGTAPIAKINTQINRRRMRKFNGKTLDPLWITPGTKLLDNLEIYLGKIFPNIYIDGSRNPGEGEMKLVHWLLKNQNTKGKIAVFGSDADLILIMSAAKPLDNISIISNDKKGIYWVELDKLWRKLPGPREDIVLVFLLLGNDYLPGLYGANFNSIWKHYSKKLFRNGKLCILNWIKYLEKLEENTLNIKDTGGNPQKYVEGLLWCLEMYSTGICPNINYIYEQEAPSLCSLIDYLKSKPKLILPKSKDEPLNVEELLLILTPRWGINILPEYLRDVINHQPLKLWYPEECKECEKFRKDVAQLSCLHTETKKYGSEMAALNSEYKKHRLSAHPKIPLPLNEIREYLFLLHKNL